MVCVQAWQAEEARAAWQAGTACEEEEWNGSFFLFLPPSHSSGTRTREGKEEAGHVTRHVSLPVGEWNACPVPAEAGRSR